MKLTILDEDGVYYLGMVAGDDIYPTTRAENEVQVMARVCSLLDEWINLKTHLASIHEQLEESDDRADI